MSRTPRAAHTRRRPARAVTAAALAAGLGSGLLTGCGAMGDLVSAGSADRADPAATGTPHPAATLPAPAEPAAPAVPPVPTVDAVRAGGTAVEADGTLVLHLLVTGAVPQVRVEPDGSETVLTLDPGDPAAAVDVLLAAPAGATLRPQDDASLLVLGPDGAFLGGAGRPLMGPGAAPARVTAQADGAVRLTGTGTITTRVGADALLDADWGEREGGRSLAVEPSAWARAAGMAGEVGTWTALVRAVPEADTQTMRDQLTCHVLGAPDKATWNLEPWRPDVGLLMTMAASCNAT